jgi:hypothetical protein
MQWQTSMAQYRAEKLEASRSALRERCKSLESKRYDLSIAAVLDFGKAMCQVRLFLTTSEQKDSNCCIFQSDVLCKGAEQKEAQILREQLVRGRDEICRSMPQLCAEFAGGSIVTRQAVENAGNQLCKRFDILLCEAWDRVRSILAFQQQLN